MGQGRRVAQTGTETREERESKQAEMEALGADPDIYQKLTNSVAPSIWQMDDVKKGILCQLFGGSSKVLSPLRFSYRGYVPPDKSWEPQ